MADKPQQFAYLRLAVLAAAVIGVVVVLRRKLRSGKADEQSYEQAHEQLDAE